MSFDVVARPVFGKADLDWLTHLRETHAHSLGPPEFTLVFPGPAAEPDIVAGQVRAACAATPRVHFCLRAAVIVPELTLGWFHVFLVPEEGFAALIRLHERLHAGPLAACLRPEEPYIPHMTVASVKEFDLARRTKSALNAHDLAVSGRIDEVEVRQRDAAEPHRIAIVPLAHHGLFR
ncbi:MAG TPA: 2'-5' RNA ligase family protein [Stellaceae bacterium]|nr:2'-5' RNA ligase family protein [Stellaceae bacterium]